MLSSEQKKILCDAKAGGIRLEAQAELRILETTWPVSRAKLEAECAGARAAHAVAKKLFEECERALKKAGDSFASAQEDYLQKRKLLTQRASGRASDLVPSIDENSAWMS